MRREDYQMNRWLEQLRWRIERLEKKLGLDFELWMMEEEEESRTPLSPDIITAIALEMLVDHPDRWLWTGPPWTYDAWYEEEDLRQAILQHYGKSGPVRYRGISVQYKNDKWQQMETSNET